MKYYRLSIAESWNDGDSWSVNNWYEQPFIVEINENSDCKSIVKSLKQAGLLKSNLRYDWFTIDWGYDEQEIFIERYYHANKEPLILKLSIVDDLESEMHKTYGLGRYQTNLCKA